MLLASPLFVNSGVSRFIFDFCDPIDQLTINLFKNGLVERAAVIRILVVRSRPGTKVKPQSSQKRYAEQTRIHQSPVCWFVRASARCVHPCHVIIIPNGSIHISHPALQDNSIQYNTIQYNTRVQDNRTLSAISQAQQGSSCSSILALDCLAKYVEPSVRRKVDLATQL